MSGRPPPRMAFTVEPPPTFPPVDPPLPSAGGNSELTASLVKRKRRLLDMLEGFPQCRPPQKVARGMERLVAQCFRRRAAAPTGTSSGAGPAVDGAAASAPGSGGGVCVAPARTKLADWDKQWSFEINELRTKPREPKSGRGVTRKDAAAAVMSTLGKDGEEEEELEDDPANVDELEEPLVDEEEEEEEPGDYTSSYFDNGEEETNEAEDDE